VGAGFVVAAAGGATGGASMDAAVGHRSVQSAYPKLGPFTVRLIPYNWRGTEEVQTTVIAMDFAAYPPKPEFGELLVDLAAIRLRTADGIEHGISAYARTYPSISVSYGCNLSDGAHRRFPRSPPPPDAPRLSVTGEKVQVAGQRSVSDCLDLYFNTARLTSSERFAVLLAGVEYNGVRYSDVEITFKEHFGR
jgi:hypothetical protein